MNCVSFSKFAPGVYPRERKWRTRVTWYFLLTNSFGRGLCIISAAFIVKDNVSLSKLPFAKIMQGHTHKEDKTQVRLNKLLNCFKFNILYGGSA